METNTVSVNQVVGVNGDYLGLVRVYTMFGTPLPLGIRVGYVARAKTLADLADYQAHSVIGELSPYDDARGLFADIALLACSEVAA